jgi:Tfp pilus assembly protein PilV
MIFPRNKFSRQRAFTLMEVVIACLVAALFVGGTINGYIQSGRFAEWSSHSLAAQFMAMQRLEQTRACRWDLSASPTVDELVTNSFPVLVSLLDLPSAGTNYTYATNYTTISTISNTPPIRMIKVETVWKFINGKLQTNSIACYRSPDAI